MGKEKRKKTAIENNWTTGQQQQQQQAKQKNALFSNISRTHSIKQYECTAQGVRVEWLRRFAFNFAAEFPSIGWHGLAAWVSDTYFTRHCSTMHWLVNLARAYATNRTDSIFYTFVDVVAVFLLVPLWIIVCGALSPAVAVPSELRWKRQRQRCQRLPERTEWKWKCQYWMTNDNIFQLLTPTPTPNEPSLLIAKYADKNNYCKCRNV